MAIEDILAFADDRLVICDGIEQLRHAIETIKSWCSESNIQLNPLKFSIVEMLPRWKKLVLQVGSFVNTIPLVESYKYLGLILDMKLTGEP